MIDMSKNYIPEIAKMLGVKIGEEFGAKMAGTETVVFPARFENNCLMLCNANGEWHKNVPWLQFLLDGSAEIVKKPWKPEPGGSYWCWDSYDCVPGVTEDFYDGTFFDKMRIRLGNCYPTKEAAEADGEKWERFYASDERIDWENEL